MNIYLIQRNDFIDYDEHDAAVIQASTEPRCRELAKQLNGLQRNRPEVWDRADITYIGEAASDAERIILSSFLAG